MSERIDIDVDEGHDELYGALCAKFDPGCWMPEHESDYRPGGMVEQAVAICNRCPVRIKCLEFAMRMETSETGEPLSGRARYGIYGGLTAQQRGALAKGANDAA